MDNPPNTDNNQKNKYEKYKDIKKYYLYYIFLIWFITLSSIKIISIIKKPKDQMGYNMGPQMGYNMGPQMGYNMGPPMNMQQGPPMNMPINEMMNMASLLPNQYGKMAKNINKFTGQMGGNPLLLFSLGSSIFNNLWWLLPIIIATILTLYILFKYAPKSKKVAYFIHFASIPLFGLPFSRLYIDQVKDNDYMYMYLFPPFGWTVDLFQYFFNTLKPKNGWG